MIEIRLRTKALLWSLCHHICTSPAVVSSVFAYVSVFQSPSSGHSSERFKTCKTSEASQWSRLLPSFCPSCRAAMARLKCSFRFWISRSLRPFIPLSSSWISAYRSHARRFSYGPENGRRVQWKHRNPGERCRMFPGFKTTRINIPRYLSHNVGFAEQIPTKDTHRKSNTVPW